MSLCRPSSYLRDPEATASARDCVESWMSEMFSMIKRKKEVRERYCKSTQVPGSETICWNFRVWQTIILRLAIDGFCNSSVAWKPAHFNSAAFWILAVRLGSAREAVNLQSHISDSSSSSLKMNITLNITLIWVYSTNGVLVSQTRRYCRPWRSGSDITRYK